MRKKLFIFLTVLLTLSIAIFATACNGEQVKDLQAPENLRQEGFNIIWDKVENAAEYITYIDGREYQTTTECSINLRGYKEGIYEVEVIAANKNIVSYGSKITVSVTEVLEDGFDELGFLYVLLPDESGYAVHAGNADLKGTVTIPDYFCNLPVKRIINYAFTLFIGEIPPDASYIKETLCNTVTKKIILPAFCERIDELALAYMVRLEEVVMPDTVTYIGPSAFEGDTHLKRVNISKSLKKIPDYAFKNTALEALTLPDGLEEIGNEAFYCETTQQLISTFHVESDLFSVVIPSSVKVIGDNAFAGREKLSDVKIPETVQLGTDVFTGTFWHYLQ